eukprot:TRINITY_DN6774_c3_g1_i1.p1 TRINITY_DN6774_c3_g1~~TRINITY_DN6774_c3_g1_i1.p1  ORF type:complete len:228 (+),score=30.95 TRINITY_DN6774_c3_g1_i1:55-684(+)
MERNEDASPFDCPLCMEAFAAEGAMIPYFLLCACSSAQSMCIACMDDWKQRSGTCPHCRQEWGQKKLRNGNLIWILEKRMALLDEVQSARLKVSNAEFLVQSKTDEIKALRKKLAADASLCESKDQKVRELQEEADRFQKLVSELSAENIKAQKELAVKSKKQHKDDRCVECDGKAIFRCATCTTNSAFCKECFQYSHKYITNHITEKL